MPCVGLTYVEVVVAVTALDVVATLVTDLDHKTASGGLDKTVLVRGGTVSRAAAVVNAFINHSTHEKGTE